MGENIFNIKKLWSGYELTNFDTKLLNRKVIAYKIYACGTELNVDSISGLNTFNHGFIQFIDDKTNVHTYDWGVEGKNFTPDDVMILVPSALTSKFEPVYTRDKDMLCVLIRECKLTRSKQIDLTDVLKHAISWREHMGHRKKTSYPHNCYGYVDSVLMSLFKHKKLSKNNINWSSFYVKVKRKVKPKFKSPPPTRNQKIRRSTRVRKRI